MCYRMYNAKPDTWYQNNVTFIRIDYVVLYFILLRHSYQTLQRVIQNGKRTATKCDDFKWNGYSNRFLNKKDWQWKTVGTTMSSLGMQA